MRSPFRNVWFGTGALVIARLIVHALRAPVDDEDQAGA